MGRGRHLSAAARKARDIIEAQVEAKYKYSLKYSAKYAHGWVKDLNIEGAPADFLNSFINHIGTMLDTHPGVALGSLAGLLAGVTQKVDGKTILGMVITGGLAGEGLNSKSEAVGVASVLTLATYTALILKPAESELRQKGIVVTGNAQTDVSYLKDLVDSLNQAIAEYGTREVPANLVMQRDLAAREYKKAEERLRLEATSKTLTEALWNYRPER